jgi:hypothetical protein
MRKFLALTTALVSTGVSPASKHNRMVLGNKILLVVPNTTRSAINKIGFETRLNACLCSKLGVFLKKEG